MSELTEFEICESMAKINDLDYQIDVLEGEVLCPDSFGNYVRRYNPVGNDCTNHKEMIKHEITPEFTRYYEHIKSKTVKAFWGNRDDQFIRDVNANKAICLAIIEANKDKL